MNLEVHCFHKQNIIGKEKTKTFKKDQTYIQCYRQCSYCVRYKKTIIFIKKQISFIFSN
jgi:hypothetical protein